MDGDFFFVLGIVLVIAAVSLAFVGARAADRFPPNRGVLVGGTALFLAVGGLVALETGARLFRYQAF